RTTSRRGFLSHGASRVTIRGWTSRSGGHARCFSSAGRKTIGTNRTRAERLYAEDTTRQPAADYVRGAAHRSHRADRTWQDGSHPPAREPRRDAAATFRPPPDNRHAERARLYRGGP